MNPYQCEVQTKGRIASKFHRSTASRYIAAVGPPQNCWTCGKTTGRFLLLSACLFVLLSAGCGIGPETSEYGSVIYPTKNSSINGLGVFEKLCTQAGSRCIVANRLSSRLERVDAIILVGDTMHPPAKEARDWLEEWLAGEPGRTVVYFGRDFDADIYYRERTLEQVPAESHHKAVIDLMLARMRIDTQLMEQIPDDVFCRWFTLRMHEPRREFKQFRGPWADGLAAKSATWPVRVVLEPPDPAQAANKPKWPAQAATTTLRVQLATPNPPAQNEGGQRVVFTSQWSEWDIGDDETWQSEWEKAPESEVLLSGDDGTPLVTRLTSERYPDSQILSIVNGAPLLNGTLIEPHFRQIAHKIIEDIQPAKRIALLPYDDFGILVSLLEEDENEIAGLTVLTTWPMNIIVAHLAFLGILVCLALFPILGRPQKLRQRTLADFGQHAESLGQMLQRTGDLSFALEAIADYHRTVRGEAVPGWVESALRPPSSASTSSGHSPSHPPSTMASQATGDAMRAPAGSAPASVDPNAVISSPVTSSPVTSSPVTSSPVTSSPVTSSPAQPQSQTGSHNDSSS